MSVHQVWVWKPVSSLTTGAGLSRWEKYYFGMFLMAAQFIFISLSLVCMKGDCHLCFVEECQWFGQINLQHSTEPQKIARPELTFLAKHWHELQFYSIFQGLEDCILVILCQIEYQLYFLLIMESRNKDIDLIPCIYISVCCINLTHLSYDISNCLFKCWKHKRHLEWCKSTFIFSAILWL